MKGNYSNRFIIPIFVIINPIKIMLIAKKLKQENIIEYLLYMWQVEDIIRANDFDLERIDNTIISKFGQSPKELREIREWYGNLIEMMNREEIKDKGHLIINKNTLSVLADLHDKLLKSSGENDYINTYYKTLPYIVELRAKSPGKEVSEIETCLSALYGFLLMRIQKKEISGETQAAISQISTLLRQLSQKYNDDKNGRLQNIYE